MKTSWPSSSHQKISSTSGLSNFLDFSPGSEVQGITEKYVLISWRWSFESCTLIGPALSLLNLRFIHVRPKGFQWDKKWFPHIQQWKPSAKQNSCSSERGLDIRKNSEWDASTSSVVNYSWGFFVLFSWRDLRYSFICLRAYSLLNLLEIPDCCIIRSQQDIIKDTTYIWKKIDSHNFPGKERVSSIQRETLLTVSWAAFISMDNVPTTFLSVSLCWI